MQLLRNDRLANRVMLGLVAGLALVLAGWAWVRWNAPETARPAISQYFSDTVARSATALDDRITKLQHHLTDKPEDWPAYGELGLAYLQKARETGDPSYYQKADAALQETLAHNPGDYGMLSGMGELALARHDFAAALEWGTRARSLNPNRTYAFGIIADAQVELGRYDEAVATLQQMVDLRPDLSSYSRISYLRELNGDTEGALEAMQWAVDAGGSTAENTLWTRTQLGHLFFNNGRLTEAETEYQRILALDPNYVHALAGLARVRAAQNKFDDAIGLYTTVTERMPLAEYIVALGQVHEAAGRSAEAQTQFELARAIDQLYRAQGVNTDLEYALFLADHGSDAERADAVTRARLGYEQRPTVYAADVLAWTLYRTGQYTEAQKYAQLALRLGTRDALKFFHAGMIALAVDDSEQARDYLQTALEINPDFSLRFAAKAREAITKLGR
ncbi:MAG: tetratricopeptide repeat protein [Anaerolineales bacterium]